MHTAPELLQSQRYYNYLCLMAYAMVILISLSLSIILVAPTICSLLVCKSGLGMGPIYYWTASWLF